MAKFSYCMNVHPADNFDGIIQNLKTYAKPIAVQVSQHGEMGVELHLNHIVAKETLTQIQKLKENLQTLNLNVFSINNFPLIDFHQPVVKDKVYLPSWANKERAEITITCAKILAQLLQQNETGSISTLAGAYRFHPEANHIETICNHYLDVYQAITTLNQQFHIKMTLALEPEPDTTLDSFDSIIQFFETDLAQAATKRSINLADVKEIIGLNLDACHASVIFEKPAEILQKLQNFQIQVFKFHITNAPILKPPFTTQKIKAFQKLNETKYLHQTFALDQNKKIQKFKDLTDFPFGRCYEFEEVRTHFHVPLNLTDFDTLQTTNQEVAELLKAARQIPCQHHFVSETYTWPQHVNAQNITNFNLINAIAEEVSWMMKTWSQISNSSTI